MFACVCLCVTEESRGPRDSASITLIKLSQAYLKNRGVKCFWYFVAFSKHGEGLNLKSFGAWLRESGFHYSAGTTDVCDHENVEPQ